MAHKYPHLLKEDIRLWEEFLSSPHNIYSHFDYDIQVGDGRDPGPAFPQYIRDMALNISRRRIDVIAWTGTDITIIEISINAGLTQIAQMQAYPFLYKTTYQPKFPLKRLLIVRTIQTDIKPVLLDQKIPFIIVPTANP